MRHPILAALAAVCILFLAGAGMAGPSGDKLINPQIQGTLYLGSTAQTNPASSGFKLTGLQGTQKTDVTLDLDEANGPIFSVTKAVDVLRFAEDLAFTAAHSITTEAGNLTLAPTADLLLTPTGGDIDITGDMLFTLGAAQKLLVDGATTAHTSTDGVLDLNLSATAANVVGADLAITQANGAGAGDDLFGLNMTLTGNDADGNLYGVKVVGAATANAGAGTYPALISLDCAENTAGACTDGLVLTSSGVNLGVTDGLDVSAANIDNAVNVGSNDITGVSFGIETTSALTLGDLLTGTNASTVAIYSADWEIGTTGDASGFGALTMDGTLTMTGANINLDPTGTFDMSMDPAQVASVHVSDNLANAFLVEETVGGDDYLMISTANAAEGIAFGNAVTNPTVGFLGTGQITAAGNIDATNGLDVSVAPLSMTGTNIDLDPTGTFDLAMDGAQTVTVGLADDLAGNLTIQEAGGGDDYLMISTDNGAEAINFGNAVTNPSFGFLGTGTVTIANGLTVTAGGVSLPASSIDDTEIADIARQVPLPITAMQNCTVGAPIEWNAAADAAPDFAAGATAGSVVLLYDATGGSIDSDVSCIAFNVPIDYSSGGKFKMRVSKTAETAGSVETYSMAVSINDAAYGAPSSANIVGAAIQTLDVTPAGAYAAGDSVVYAFTQTAAGADDGVRIHSLSFEYMSKE